MDPSPAAKLGLMVVNCITLVYSLVIIVLSSVTLVSYYDFFTLLYHWIVAVPGISIGVASAAFLLSIFGLVVSTKKSYCLGITFCVLISVVLLLELTLGIAFYVIYFISAWNSMSNGLYASIAQYPIDRDYTQDWDWMQRQYGCCGVADFFDWDPILNASIRGLPLSCCEPIIGDIGNTSCRYTSANLNDVGCLEQISPVFMYDAYVSGGMLLGLALLNIACIIVGSIFTHPLKNAW